MSGLFPIELVNTVTRDVDSESFLSLGCTSSFFYIFVNSTADKDPILVEQDLIRSARRFFQSTLLSNLPRGRLFERIEYQTCTTLQIMLDNAVIDFNNVFKTDLLIGVPMIPTLPVPNPSGGDMTRSGGPGRGDRKLPDVVTNRSEGLNHPTEANPSHPERVTPSHPTDLNFSEKDLTRPSDGNPTRQSDRDQTRGSVRTVVYLVLSVKVGCRVKLVEVDEDERRYEVDSFSVKSSSLEGFSMKEPESGPVLEYEPFGRDSDVSEEDY